MKEKAVKFLKSILLEMKRVCFKMFGFNRNEFITISVALAAKKNKNFMWYLDNLIIPISIIFLPYSLTLVSHDFNKINFNKSLLQLALTGSISLLGINVMRASLSLVNEKIDTNSIPESLRKNITDDVESIKSKLRRYIQLLTIIGVIAYFIQAGELIDYKITSANYYLLSILAISLLSVHVSRIIVVIQSNFADNEMLIKVWLEALSYNNEKDYDNLKSLAKSGGL